jgi:hypothetical protein
MASVTTLNEAGANAIQEGYDGSFTEALYYNNGLFGMVNPDTGLRVFPVEPNPGDTKFRWKVHSSKAGAATRISSEADTHPAARPESFVNVSEDYVYVWFTLEVTKQAMDSLASRWFDPVVEAMELGKQEMMDLFTTTYLTDSSLGLPAMISASGTYAGVTRGSSSWLESAEDATNTTFTRAVFQDLIQTARKPPKKAKTALYLMPTDVIATYADLADTTNIDRRDVVTGGGEGFDLGFHWNGMRLFRKPILEMDDMVATDVFGIDPTPGNFKMIDRHALEVRPLPPSGYNERLEVSRGIGLFCKNPVKQVRWDASV